MPRTVNGTGQEELPAEVVKQIGKRHPLLIPPFTNDTLRRAVNDYLAGGARKEDIVDKYGEINNWDVSNVTDMALLFRGASSFNQPLNKWNVSKVYSMSFMFWHAESFNQPLNNWNVICFLFIRHWLESDKICIAFVVFVFHVYFLRRGIL